MIFVDTPIWSEALRRRHDSGNPEVLKKFSGLVLNKTAVMIGSVRQEVLSGIRDPAVFGKIRKKLELFPDFVPEQKDYVFAAELYNRCRSSGIQGSHTDILICALSLNYHAPIFTLDQDFDHFSRVIPIRLVKV